MHALISQSSFQLLVFAVRDIALLLQSFDIYYSSMTLKNAAGQITKFGASGRLSGGENAVYNSAPPSVASFSARGPDMIIGTANATQLDVPVADIMKPNVMAPGVNIWAAWSPIPGTEDMSSIG